jgi:hypothetical protein
MPSFEFSEEARVYAQNHAVVDVVRRKWESDIDRFHVELFHKLKAVVTDLESVPPTKRTIFPEWTRSKWSNDRTYIAFWRDRYYPALIGEVASRLMWKMALAPLPADVGDSYIT